MAHDDDQDLETTFNEVIGDSVPPAVRSVLARGLVKAAEVGAERALDAVDKVARRDLVRKTAVIVAVVTAGLAIPITYVITNENSASIRHQAKIAAHKEVLTNCKAQSSARPQGNARAFAQLAFLALLQDALAPPPSADGASQRARAFGRKELMRIEGKANGWRQFTVLRDAGGKITGNELPAKISSFTQLAGTIKPVPLIDCHALLG